MTITYAIIGITVLISLYALSNQNTLRGFMMNPYMISHRQQYYRFITSGFIHNDHMHLLVNMFSFYFFGSAMEEVFHAIFGKMGGFYFIALYVLAIVVSDLPTFFKHKNNPGYNALGASGGVAAVIFAFIIFEPLQKICIYFALCMPGFILGTLYIIYSYYQGKRSGDNINHDAHLYGALFGLIFCSILYPACIGQFIEQLQQWKPFN
ncbi:MAG: rhomboid family intramembrane serine protease [Cyclobacteriaceae bacterium]|nr:rhomboid family intramembrane serine protease [Cyclobacteriaceae bacterium]